MNNLRKIVYELNSSCYIKEDLSLIIEIDMH